ncbi:MAG: acyl carrier protein [Clostridia bacterium]|nr:acyl carrier protein [Clostridia bacterium]
MSTLERLYNVITDVFEKMNQSFPHQLSDITPESNLKNDLGLDSLAFVMIMLKIEEEFKVSLSVDGMSACETVGDVINVVEGVTA